MENVLRIELRHVIDWSAATWAGLIAAVAFWVVMVITTGLTVGEPFVFNQAAASLVLGPAALPPAPLVATTFVIGLLVHIVLSLALTYIIALALHRWGVIVGVIGGGILGLAFYAINFFTLTLIFPWMFAYNGWHIVLAHIAFGAFAGGVYELLEVDEYVAVISPVETPETTDIIQDEERANAA